MKIMYTHPIDGGVSIVIAAPKGNLEKVLGPLTYKEYKAYVIDKSVPKGALKVKVIKDKDLPASREFREAWVDVTNDTKVNIDMTKVKEIKLKELRKIRNEELAKTDIEVTKALESNNSDLLSAERAYRSNLRNATEGLKALKTDGAVDDDKLLAEMDKLSVLPKK